VPAEAWRACGVGSGRVLLCVADVYCLTCRSSILGNDHCGGWAAGGARGLRGGWCGRGVGLGRVLLRVGFACLFRVRGGMGC